MTDHWIGFFPRYGGLSSTNTALKVAPDVKGVMRRFMWKDLYTLDQIDLTELKAYAAAMKAANKRVSIMVEDKTFDNETNMMPDHMKHLAVPSRHGFTALRWKKEVREELTKLLLQIQALPDVHSVSLMETALSLPDRLLTEHGYTPQIYAQYYIQLFKDLYAATRKRPVFWYQNFFPKDQPGTYIDTVIEAVKDLGTLRLGGPDWWPTNEALNKRTYPRYAKWHAEGVYTFIMMSTPSYAQWVDGAYNTPKEMLDGAVETLHVSNVIWCFTRMQPVEGAYDFYDAAYLMHP